jgi:hypothetical protein
MSEFLKNKYFLMRNLLAIIEFLKKTTFSKGKCPIGLGYFSLKKYLFSGIQTFLWDFSLTKHLFLKKSDIFRGFSFNKVLIFQEFR